MLAPDNSISDKSDLPLSMLSDRISDQRGMKPQTKRELNKVTFSPTATGQKRDLTTGVSPRQSKNGSTLQQHTNSTAEYTSIAPGSACLEKYLKPQMKEKKLPTKKERIQKQAEDAVNKHLKLSDVRISSLDRKQKRSPLEPVRTKITRPDTDLMNLSSVHKGESIPNFDTSKYRMHNSLKFDFDGAQYKEKFYQNLGANKKHINQQLAQLTYLQIDEKLNDSSVTNSLPKVFEENKALWSRQIIQSKDLQNIYAEFTNRIAVVIENELKANNDMTSEYLKYPHRCNIRKRQVSAKTSPVWLPSTEPQTTQHQALAVHKVEEQIAAATERGQRLKSEQEAKKRSDQFKDRMKQAFAMKVGSELNKKDNKVLMTPLQEELAGHFDSMQKKIDNIQENNDDINEFLPAKILEQQFKQVLSAEKNQKKMDIELRNAFIPPYEPKLKEYAGEFWMSLRDFENHLFERQLGCEIELQKKTQAFNSRVDGIRKATSFRMEALESALAQTKMKYQREAECAQMYASEMESYLMNKEVDEKQIEKIDSEADLAIQKAMEFSNSKGDGFNKKSAQEQSKAMLKIMKDLKKTNESLKLDKVMLNNQIREIQHKVGQNQKFLEHALVNQKNTLMMVRYYQSFLTRVLKQGNFFEEGGSASQEDRLLFQQMNDVKEQYAIQDAQIKNSVAEGMQKPDAIREGKRFQQYIEDIHQIMKTLKIDNLFESYQQVMESRSKLMDQMVSELTETGLIDQTKASGAVVPEKYLAELQKKKEEKQQQIVEEQLEQGLEPSLGLPRKTVTPGKQINLRVVKPAQKDNKIQPSRKVSSKMATGQQSSLTSRQNQKQIIDKASEQEKPQMGGKPSLDYQKKQQNTTQNARQSNNKTVSPQRNNAVADSPSPKKTNSPQKNKEPPSPGVRSPIVRRSNVSADKRSNYSVIEQRKDSPRRNSKLIQPLVTRSPQVKKFRNDNTDSEDESPQDVASSLEAFEPEQQPEESELQVEQVDTTQKAIIQQIASMFRTPAQSIMMNKAKEMQEDKKKQRQVLKRKQDERKRKNEVQKLKNEQLKNPKKKVELPLNTDLQLLEEEECSDDEEFMDEEEEIYQKAAMRLSLEKRITDRQQEHTKALDEADLKRVKIEDKKMRIEAVAREKEAKLQDKDSKGKRGGKGKKGPGPSAVKKKGGVTSPPQTSTNTNSTRPNKKNEEQILVPGLTTSNDEDEYRSVLTEKLDVSAPVNTRTIFKQIDAKLKLKYKQQFKQEVGSDDNSDTEEEEEHHPLSTRNFEKLYAAFKESLGMDDVDPQDYMELYQCDSVEKVMTIMNRIQLKIVSDTLASEKASHSVMSRTISPLSLHPKKKRVPFTDCLMSHIDDQSGELIGFTVRPLLVQMIFDQEVQIETPLKLIEACSLMNKIISGQSDEVHVADPGTVPSQVVTAIHSEKNFVCGKCGGPPTGNFEQPGGTHSGMLEKGKRSVMQDYNNNPASMTRGRGVIRPKVKTSNRYLGDDTKITTQPKEVGNDDDKVSNSAGGPFKQTTSRLSVAKEPDDQDSSSCVSEVIQQPVVSVEGISGLHKEFINLVREHVITMIKREDPTGRGYYKMVWEDQTFEELLDYKMDKVHKSLDHASDDLSLTDGMQVIEYFKGLMSILENKLVMNIPVDEKEHLDMYKWVWDGDFLEEEDDSVPEVVEQLPDKEEQKPKPKVVEETSPVVRVRTVRTRPVKKDLENKATQTEDVEAEPMQQQQGRPKIYKTTGVQTPTDLLPERIVKDEVPVFKEEDIAIQIDSVIGAELDATVHKLQDFVTINKLSRILDAKATLLRNLGPFDKGYKVKGDSFSVEEKAAQKKHRKELVKILREDVKGTIEIMNQSIAENRQFLNKQLQNHCPPGRKTSTSTTSSQNKSPETLIRFENSQLPCLEPLQDKVQQQMGYESEDQLNKSPKTRNNPFKQVNPRLGNVYQARSMHNPLNIDLSNVPATILQVTKIRDSEIELSVQTPNGGPPPHNMTWDPSDNSNQNTFFTSQHSLGFGQAATGKQKLNVTNFPSLPQTMASNFRTQTSCQFWRDKNGTLVQKDKPQMIPISPNQDLLDKNSARNVRMMKTRQETRKEMNLLMKSVDCARPEIKIKENNHVEVNRYLRQTIIPKATAVQDGKFLSFQRKRRDNISPRIISPLQAWKNTSASPLGEAIPSFDLRAYTSDSRHEKYLPERSSRDSQITLDMMIKHPTMNPNSMSPSISINISQPSDSKEQLRSGGSTIL